MAPATTGSAAHAQRLDRDLGPLTLPQAIAKMTGGGARTRRPRPPARRPGRRCVLFDPATIIDRSTYDPHQYLASVGTVIVNGTIVIDGGEHTGALPGRLLRRRGAVLA